MYRIGLVRCCIFLEVCVRVSKVGVLSFKKEKIKLMSLFDRDSRGNVLCGCGV